MRQSSGLSIDAWLDQCADDWSVTELAYMRVIMHEDRIEYREGAHVRQEWH